MTVSEKKSHTYFESMLMWKSMAFASFTLAFGFILRELNVSDVLIVLVVVGFLGVSLYNLAILSNMAMRQKAN